MYKAIIFDLDGTIANTIEDITTALNNALIKNNLPTHNIQKLTLMVGKGAKTLCKEASSYPTNDERLDKLLKDYDTEYLIQNNRFSSLYPNILSLLTILHLKNIPMAILTNKPQKWTINLLRHLSIFELFDIISGQGLGFLPKPNPEALVDIIQKWKIKPEEAILLGDSETDIATARNAGTLSLAVSWGYRTKNDLLKHKPDAIIESPLQVLSYFGYRT